MCLITIFVYVGSEWRGEEDISNIVHLCSVAIAIPKVAWRYEYHRGNGRHRH